MYLFLFFVLLIPFGIYLLKTYTGYSNEGLQIVGGLSVIVGTICTIVMTIDAINPNDDYAFVTYVKSTQATINSQRIGEISEMERATITSKIMEINQQIASKQFMNTTNWDLWYRDTLMTLKPIE